MSAQHTPGKLQVIHGGYLTIVGTGERIGRCGNHGPWMENGRRLAACWNACEGIDTQYLESYGLPDFAQKISDLAAQKDQLLKAAQDALKFMGDEPLKTQPYGTGYRLVSDLSPAMRVMGRLEAAIAACQPQPTIQHLPADDTEGGAA